MGLGPITVGITADISNFAKEAKKGFSDAMPEIDLSAKHLGRMAGEAITTGVKVGMVAIGAAVTAALAGATYAFTSFTQQGFALADSLADTSQSLGVNASQLLLFREAAQQAGADVVALEQGMSKFNIRVGDAILGNAAAIQSFAQIGISVSQLVALDPAAQFQLVADKMGQIPDAAVRASLAMDIFGKSGAPIAKALGAISESSIELSNYWIEMGAVITEAQIQAAGGIQDRIDLMHSGLDRFKILLASEMVPYLEYTLNLMEESVKETGGLAPVAAKAAAVFGDIVAVALNLWDVAKGIGYALRGIGRIIVGVGEVWTAHFMLAWGGAKMLFGKMGAALSKFLGTAIQKFRAFGDFISDIFVGVWDGISNIFKSGFGAMIDAWNWLVDATGIGTKATWTWTGKGQDAPKKSEAGPLEKSLLAAEKYFSEMGTSGEDLMRTVLKQDLTKSFKGALDDFTKSGDAFSSFGKAGEEFKDGVAQAAKDVADKLANDKKPKDKTNQQWIDEYNMQHGYPSTNIGVQLPSSANYNTTPVSSYGPPVTVNQQFATGVSAQELRTAAQTIKRETIAAVQTKVSQGGNYRREIQC